MVNPMNTIANEKIGLRFPTQEHPIQVLCVDRDTGSANTVKLCLELHGSFEIDIVSSVEAAKEKMKMKTFEVIVSDCVTPQKHGSESLKELRKQSNGIPLILFAIMQEKEAKNEAVKVGADACIGKFGDPETVYRELAHTITRLVKERRAVK
jgi:DNA-binding NtrC family response regulator